MILPPLASLFLEFLLSNDLFQIISVTQVHDHTLNFVCTSNRNSSIFLIWCILSSDHCYLFLIHSFSHSNSNDHLTPSLEWDHHWQLQSIETIIFSLSLICLTSLFNLNHLKCSLIYYNHVLHKPSSLLPLLLCYTHAIYQNHNFCEIQLFAYFVPVLMQLCKVKLNTQPH